jgi:hypothetical protein
MTRLAVPGVIDEHGPLLLRHARRRGTPERSPMRPSACGRSSRRCRDSSPTSRTRPTTGRRSPSEVRIARGPRRLEVPTGAQDDTGACSPGVVRGVLGPGIGDVPRIQVHAYRRIRAADPDEGLPSRSGAHLRSRNGTNRCSGVSYPVRQSAAGHTCGAVCRSLITKWHRSKSAWRDRIRWLSGSSGRGRRSAGAPRVGAPCRCRLTPRQR